MENIMDTIISYAFLLGVIAVGGLILLGIGYYVYLSFSGGRKYLEMDEKQKAMIKSILEQQYNLYHWISIGMSYAEIKGRLGEGELLLEELNQGNIHKTIYIWYFGWHTAEMVEGETYSSGHTSLRGFTGSRDSCMSGNITEYSETTNKHKKRVFIRLVFENDKLISKEQQGYLKQ